MLAQDGGVAASGKIAPARISKAHGSPAGVIIPKRYAWKGAKFIHEIRSLAQDTLGFWEVRGYFSTAAPRLDDRFAYPTTPPE